MLGSKLVLCYRHVVVVAVVLLMATGAAWATVADLSWCKNDGNPIISTSPRGAPCVLKDGDIYRMWLSANADGIYHSTSVDGVTWSEPVMILDSMHYANWEPWVIKDGDTYKMWYRVHTGTGQPGDSWISYATSADGLDWTVQSTVLTVGASGDYDSRGVARPRVIHDQDNYKMWYEASDGVDMTVGYATSPDGMNWTKNTSPVLTAEAGTFWSSGISPAGVFQEGGYYYLLTSCWDGQNGRLGLAWSVDGVNFTCSSDPIVDLGSAGQWDAYSTGSSGPRGGACMLRIGDEYRLWYTGQPAAGVSYQIGMARAWPTVADLSWYKNENNPVIATSPRGAPCVLKDGDIYRMWLSANADGIYHSTSADGVSWSEPVKVLDSMHYANWEPWVIIDGGTYKMWYRVHTGGGQPGDSWISYATSTDGLDWTVQSTVLTVGASGSYDSRGVARPRVIHYQDNYKMWYEASDGVDMTVGYATSPDGINWAKSPSPVLTAAAGTFWSSGISPAGVFQEGGYYYLLTSCLDGQNGRLGLAWSIDGVSFTCSYDPIVDLGSAGQWDAYSTGSSGPRGGACMLKIGDDYQLWYTGQPAAGVSYQIGMVQTSPLAGDANADGRVNLDDFIILKQNYGKPGSWSQGDFNGDGLVNLDDFIILKQNYGSIYGR